MAVNEENAAGVVPALAHYYERLTLGADLEGILRFFLTSAAIGILYKENASISGAEVGCQGEVGVARSMAVSGLTAALGGSNGQVEHAAEIAMEHNLGMTCDPIGGLVQIPCIERNAMGAAKAVHASRLALNELEAHKVSLDQVIRTMYLTGLDMQSRYKETSLAGLALNVIECQLRWRGFLPCSCAPLPAVVGHRRLRSGNRRLNTFTTSRPTRSIQT